MQQFCNLGWGGNSLGGGGKKIQARHMAIINTLRAKIIFAPPLKSDFCSFLFLNFLSFLVFPLLPPCYLREDAHKMVEPLRSTRSEYSTPLELSGSNPFFKNFLA